MYYLFSKPKSLPNLSKPTPYNRLTGEIPIQKKLAHEIHSTETPFHSALLQARIALLQAHRGRKDSNGDGTQFIGDELLSHRGGTQTYRG